MDLSSNSNHNHLINNIRNDFVKYFTELCPRWTVSVQWRGDLGHWRRPRHVDSH